MIKKKDYAVVLDNNIIAVFLDKQAAIAYNKIAKNHADNNKNPETLHSNRVRLIEFVTIEDNLKRGDSND
jgi:hypothetical protein